MMVANIKPKIQVPKTAETPPSRRMPNKNVLPFFQKLAAVSMVAIAVRLSWTSVL